MCKHGRALVELGLLAAPIAPAVRPFTPRPSPVPTPTPAPVATPPALELPAPPAEVLAPEPCCDVEEPTACKACVTLGELPTIAAEPPAVAPEVILAPALEVVAPELAEAHCVCSECISPTVGDPAESDTWELGPHINAEEPSAADLEELNAWTAETEARDFLDRSGTLPLAELIDRQANFYRGWGNPHGAMLAEAMECLALQARMTDSNTPGELATRVDELDVVAREQHEAIGYAAGLEAGRREAQPARTNIDDPAQRRGRPSSHAAHGAFPMFQPCDH